MKYICYIAYDGGMCCPRGGAKGDYGELIDCLIDSQFQRIVLATEDYGDIDSKF